MLCAYFDESFEHEKGSGQIVRLTIGGAIAPLKRWATFSPVWRALLEDAKITEFHMVDFENYRGEFQNWTREKHQRFLNAALECIASHVKAFVGFTNTTPGATVKAAYEVGIADALVQFAADSAFSYEQPMPIQLVVAEHPEFSKQKLQSLFDIANWGESRLTGVRTEVPRSEPPLQVADLIAYEIRCSKRTDGSPVDRYPLRRLRELGGRVRSYGF